MFVLVGASDGSDAPIAQLTQADCHHRRQAIDWDRRTAAMQTAEVVRGDLATGSTRLLLFFGHPRSGHSIVGSILDSHPAAAIANEYDLLNRLARQRGQRQGNSLDDHLAGILLNSQRCSALRSQAGYNYTLAGQGRWRLPLRVIGDKKGGGSARLLARQPGRGWRVIRQLGSDCHCTITAVHVVRNPFDQIASAFARSWFSIHFPDATFVSTTFRKHAARFVFDGPATDLRVLGSSVRNLVGMVTHFFELAFANDDIRTAADAGTANITWLEIHGVALSQSPSRTIEGLCRELGLDCDDKYLAKAVALIADTPSEPSLLLRWPSNIVAAIKTCIRLLPSFTRYGAPTVLFKLKLAPPMLPELPGWNASVGCIFHPDHVARFFDRELEAAKGTFEAA